MANTRSSFGSIADALPPILAGQRAEQRARQARSCCLAGLVFLASCTAPVPSHPNLSASPVMLQAAAADPVVSMETQTLSPAELDRLLDTTPDAAYLLGPSDVISVSVYMHPELSMPAIGAVQGSGSGALITGDGTTQLPLIGTVHLGGMTLSDAQALLTDEYGKYLQAPKITIGLLDAYSLRYFLLGAFSSPGVKYPVHEMTLLEALALGGSIDVTQADLYQAYVAQGNDKLPVDLHALLIGGDLSQNVTLAAGDTIVVPSSANEDAFVLGAVGQPGPVKFEGGGLSLLQALSSAGLNLPNYTDARLAQVRVIRSTGRSAQFFVVDATRILQGQAASFALQPGDVVFVPPTAVATWNEALRQLIPALQAAAYTLSPFVSIRYLDTH